MGSLGGKACGELHRKVSDERSRRTDDRVLGGRKTHITPRGLAVRGGGAAGEGEGGKCKGRSTVVPMLKEEKEEESRKKAGSDGKSGGKSRMQRIGVAVPGGKEWK